MSYSTKRDGYYSRPAVQDHGPKFNPETFGAKIQPGTTHVVTIPGTSFFMVLSEAMMTPPPAKQGAWSDATGEWIQAPEIQRPAKYVAVMAALARSTVKGMGKRRAKCVPVLQTVEEFQAATRKAA